MEAELAVVREGMESGDDGRDGGRGVEVEGSDGEEILCAASAAARADMLMEGEKVWFAAVLIANSGGNICL